MSDKAITRAEFEAFCIASYPTGQDFSKDSAGNYTNGWMMGAFFIWQAAKEQYAPKVPQSVEEWIDDLEDAAVGYVTGAPEAAKELARTASRNLRALMAGKALVPVEPTDWILEAIRKYSAARYHPQNEYWRAEHIWKSIIKAAKGE